MKLYNTSVSRFSAKDSDHPTNLVTYTTISTKIILLTSELIRLDEINLSKVFGAQCHEVQVICKIKRIMGKPEIKGRVNHGVASISLQ
jgi:hypothetical protein